MKRKKDPRIQQIKRLSTVLGPMVEDFEIHYSQVTGDATVTFTMLDCPEAGEAKAREFTMTPEEAFWYFSGAVNGSFWTVRIMQMADANTRRN